MKFIPGRILYIGAAILVLAAQAPAQAHQAQQSQGSQQQDSDSMPGMPTQEKTAGRHHHGAKNSEAAQSANQAMSEDHMDMGPHMYMTDLRQENPADDKRAAELAATLGKAIERYKDYKLALADGFEIFHAEVPQEHYHFTNYRYAFKAVFTFDPEHPTSLLYKKTRDSYELEGAMYTAGRRATEDDLNARVPLSVARWHKHVNICLPPRGAHLQSASLKEFGFRGSIATEDACREAGGRWHAQIFNWMVHVYPYETDPAKIWAH